MRSTWLGLGLLFAACGPSVGGGDLDASGHGTLDAPPGNTFADGGTVQYPDAGQTGCGSLNNCYSVYAHSDHVLYVIDLMAKTLNTVGPFKAPQVMTPSGTKEDILTDLAVAPDGTIYGVSHTNLYTVSPTDGHVTLVGAITDCGVDNVALTFTNDGQMYMADYKGAFCKVDPKASPPTVTKIANLSGGLAISGDLVAIGDGTMYGTAYRLSPSNDPSVTNNLLVKIDPATATVTQQVGSTGFPRLYGAAYALGQVFGFTHDGSGHVVTIDPRTGVGTIYGTFTDPSTGKGISFAGAGVNSLVPAIP